jgi:hypothetical protein
MKLNGLKITKALLLIFFGAVILHLTDMTSERTTFLDTSLGWGTWFWVVTLVEAGDLFPPMTTVKNYLKGLLASLCSGFVAGLVYLLLNKVL